MNIGEHEYKGIKVWYDDWGEVWECELDRDRNRTIQREKIVDLRKRIDDFLKKEKKFVRFEVLNLPSRWRMWDTCGEVLTVTSITDTGEYWTVDAKGKRSKDSPSNLAKNTPENRQVIEDQKKILVGAKEAIETAHTAIRALAIEKDDDD